MGWTDYSDAKAFSVTQPKSFRACLGGTEGSMLSKWYGAFEWDNFTVKFHSHRGQKTGVVIEYGKNLTALEQDEDNSAERSTRKPTHLRRNTFSILRWEFRSICSGRR